jgi:hypothetical protein
VNGISPQYLLGILILNGFIDILVIAIILDKALLEEHQLKKKYELIQKRRFRGCPVFGAISAGSKASEGPFAGLGHYPDIGSYPGRWHRF